MNEDTKKLLEECNSGCKMALNSMEQVSEYVKDDGLQRIISEYKKKHEDLEEESERLLEESGLTEKKPGAMASAFSWVTTEMKLMIKDDNNQIAKLLMDGCNMGVQSIAEYQHQYGEADKEAKDIAGRLVQMEEQFAKELKGFL